MGGKSLTRVLVTGGTGFLGQHLCKRLNSLGYEVYVLGRNEKVGKELKKEGISFIQTSLTEEGKVHNACKGMKYVFHCAAFSSPWGNYEEFYQRNVVGTRNIISACEKNGVKRLIHVSTPSLYFRFDDRLGVKEEDPLPKKAVNHYAYTKRLAEKEIDLAYQRGLPVITIRPRALFGEGDTTIIPRLIKANAKKGVPMFRKGRILTDITYVGNVVDALLLCMNTREENLGEKYNITNGESMYFIDLLDRLFQELGTEFRKIHIPFSVAFSLVGLVEGLHKVFLPEKEPLLTRYSLSVIGKNQTLDITRAKEELGYSPSISVDEGIQRYVKWYQQQEGEKE